MLIYESKERFELWDFMEGLRVLVLRGGTGGLNTYNYVEVEFLGVFYLNIPTSLSGVCISKMSDEEIQHLPMRNLRKGVHGKFFAVKTEGRQFVIGALSVSAYYTKVSGILPSIRDSGITISDIEVIASSVDFN
ncbi:hypothetical protein L3C95_34675 [Chitinophaga filiformis]|uniref:hypothetical protein n=1 Tax=Chitinophaga filiformis TaxID=104663 RepID=UPI001F3AF323|nr:hypothetical protein [Chitinophaga filiformis]MCF6408085.1 hypothetical protein [Chitinophaga filiformis]